MSIKIGAEQDKGGAAAERICPFCYFGEEKVRSRGRPPQPGRNPRVLIVMAMVMVMDPWRKRQAQLDSSCVV